MRMNAERCFTLIILAVTLVAGGMAFMLNNIARRMPLIAVVFLLVSLFAYFIAQIGKTDKRDKDKEWISKSDARMLGWIIAFCLLLLVLGVIPGCGVFTILFYRMEAKRGWKDSIVFGLLLWLIFWLVFNVALKEELYAGFLEWL